MMSVVIAQSGTLADHLHALHVALAVVGAAHRLQDAARARLQRQVDVLAEARQLGVRGDQARARPSGAGSCSGCARCPRPRPRAPAGRRSRSAPPSAGRARRSSRSGPAGSPPLTPSAASASTSSHDRPRRLCSRPRVDGTMQYEHTQLQPTEICTHAWNGRSRFGGRSPGSPRTRSSPAPRGRRMVRNSPSLSIWPGPEGHVHERELLEDLVLQRLRPAAADAHDPLRVLALQPLGLAQVADQPVVGRLADRAGVEEDQVGAVALGRLLVAERLEHALHALRSRARSSGTRRW